MSTETGSSQRVVLQLITPWLSPILFGLLGTIAVAIIAFMAPIESITG